ncbi:hypothetical protein Pmani_020423 [Petrolisthes manimaculis]|uniref:Uncharacterized protein n=1 Tax=Petrolisthes manimaculis TaxID=1843537 RepID=A0AAE1PGB5_9EUCA|nr:hypothetical protein Pmani_020423 [Petrolisthes manimaculis]
MEVSGGRGMDETEPTYTCQLITPEIETQRAPSRRGFTRSDLLGLAASFTFPHPHQRQARGQIASRVQVHTAFWYM